MNKDLLRLKKLFSSPFRSIKAGGQTNRNYIVESQGKKFFVRLPWENAVLNRNNEGKNMVRLSRNRKLKSILPKYYSYILKKKNILDPKSKKLFHVPDGVMVAEYIGGRELTAKDFLQKEYRQRIAKTAHAFHASSVRLANRYDVFRDEIRTYRVAAEHYPVEGIVSKKRLATIKEIEKRAKKEIPISKKGISTHNDLILQNFLVGAKKKIYLLDFEYAGLNMRGGISYDFGFFFADSLFRKPAITKKLFEEFLDVVEKEYKQRLDRKEIYWSALAALLVQVWWGILRYFSVSLKERPYFKGYVQARVQGMLDIYDMFK